MPRRGVSWPSLSAPSGSQTTVVVPTWRRADLLQGCLAGIAGQTIRPAAVIVAARPDDLATLSVIRTCQATWPDWIRWTPVTRPGHVAPIKAALEVVTSDFVAFLDDDSDPAPDWLSHLLAPFSDLTVACVGGRLLRSLRGVRVRQNAGQMTWFGRHIGNVGMMSGSSRWEVVSVRESNWAWRTSVLQTLLFDPAFDFNDAILYGLDLNLQARAQGYRVMYEPRAIVLDKLGPRDPSLARENYQRLTYVYSRNYGYLALANLPPHQLLFFWAWWLGIGERQSYGVVTALVDLLRRRANLQEVRLAFSGKYAGLSLWLRSPAPRRRQHDR